ncbi:MAG: hydantoinase B/oxoprolinase family protein [Pseudomonadota bacterium]
MANKNRQDAVITEIIRNGMVATTEEMKSNLMRTAYNMIIYEALDFTVGIFDREGNTVSIGIGLPMFIRGMSNTVKRMIAHFGYAEMEEGDVLLTNDAYITGSHLNHMTFAVPVFFEGEIVGFSACMAHWQDIGGTLDGMTLDIFSEGLQMPIVKVYRKGVPNDDVFRIIELNVRIPERAMGDLRAQIAAVKTGEKRVHEMLRKYGKSTVLDAIERIFDQGEAGSRALVSQIPDGEYSAESFLDDDGVDMGKRITIRVRVVVAGDEMTIDLSGVSDQVKGFYNSGESAGIACAQVAFKCLMAPNELPINDGCFRPLTVILPEGKVVNATRPAPMRWWMTFPMTVVDTVFRALAPAIPSKVIAGHHADLCIASVHGRQPQDNKLFLYLGGLIGGGWGAKHNEDGMSATIAINDGDTHNGPSEQVEAKYPLLVERYALRADSGGAGTFRGGLGTEQVIRVMSDIMFNTQIERVECRPWGLFGGLSAMGNEVALQRKGKEEVVYSTGKVFSQMLKEGDTWTLKSGGGGGFGNPTERSLDKIEQDVRNGYVSAASARTLYGAVIDPATGIADQAASAELRTYMRAHGLPVDQPYTSRAKPAIVPGEPVLKAVRKATSRPTMLTRKAHAWHAEARAAGLLVDRCCS